MLVYHGGHVTGVMGEYHAINGYVLCVRGRAPVTRPRVVLYVVLVFVHFSADIYGRPKIKYKTQNQFQKMNNPNLKYKQENERIRSKYFS